MGEAGVWVAWGLPSRGRETNALDVLRKSRDYLQAAARDGRIERFDTVILRPQSVELGGFFLIQGSTDGTNWTTLAASKGYLFDPATGNTVTATFSATGVRYVRLTFTGNTGWPAGQLSEAQVFSS